MATFSSAHLDVPSRWQEGDNPGCPSCHLVEVYFSLNPRPVQFGLSGDIGLLLVSEFSFQDVLNESGPFLEVVFPG